MASPRWGKEAEEKSAGFVADFKDNLRRITIRLAIHERADTIDERHVLNAHEALLRTGLDRTPWWKRSQLKTGAGGLLCAFSASVPDLVPLLQLPAPYVIPACYVGIGVCLVIGTFLLVSGWLDG